MANLTPLSTTTTERGRQMMRWMVKYSPWFAYLDRVGGFELAATDFQLYPDSSSTEVQTRGLANGYTKSTETPPQPQGESLGFHGDRLGIDRSHLRDDRLGLRPIGSWVPTRLKRKFRDWTRGLERIAFRGSGEKVGDSREAKGVLTLLDGQTNVPGLGSTLVIDATDFIADDVNSLDMSIEAHRKALRNALEQILNNYNDPGVACNKQLASVLGGIADEAKKYEFERTDLWGKLEYTFGQELVRLNNGTITNEEPDNASDPNMNTTSMVVSSPDEGAFSMATNSGLYVKDHLDEEPDADTDDADREIEWECRFENAVQDKESLVRIRNIKVAKGSEVYSFLN